MAISREQEILIKIKSIIQDLSQKNEILLKEPNRLTDTEVQLFLATAHFLANHIEILKQVQSLTTTTFQKTAANHIPIFETQKKAGTKNPQKVVSITEKELTPPSSSSATMSSDVMPSTPVNIISAPAPPPVSSAPIPLPPDTPVSRQEFLNRQIDAIMAKIDIPQYTPQRVSQPPTIEQNPQVKANEDAIAPPSEITNGVESSRPLSVQGRIMAESQQQTFDLSLVISLNDKWLFIKDLFGGVASVYTEAIELVNRCASFEEADRFLQRNYSVVYKWSEKTYALNKFYTVLGRRFPK